MTDAPSYYTASSLDEALEHCKAGGRIALVTATRATIITQKHIDQWDAVGKPLLSLSLNGSGIRMRSGKSSVFYFPYQLKIITED